MDERRRAHVPSTETQPRWPEQDRRPESTDAAPDEPVTSITSKIARLLAKRHRLRVRTKAKVAGSKLRSPSTSPIPTVTGTFFPRVKIVRPEGRSAGCTTLDDGHLYGFYPRGVIKWRWDCASRVL